MNPNVPQPMGDLPTPQPMPAPQVPVTPPVAPISPVPLTTTEASVVPNASPDAFSPASPQPVFFQQPVPVVQPASSPLNPVAPLGSGPATTPPSQGKEFNKKKLIVLAGIIGGVVLLAIIGFVLYMVLMNVSKKDYQEAATQFNTVSSKNSGLTSKVSTLSSGITDDTDDEFNTAVTAVESSITALKDENTKLGNLKATRVGEGKVLYVAFNDKLTTYVADGNKLVDSVKMIRPALVICDKIGASSDTKARLAALKVCTSSLGTVGDIPNVEFKALIASLETGFTKYVTIYEGISALTDPYGSQYAQYKVLRDDSSAAQKALSTAQADFAAAIKKHDDEISVKDTANALSKYLTDQQK